jgi:molecular chaperone HscA
LLLDVIPLSLGMEMMGGVVEKILMRNTPIPAVATERFTTYQDGQTGFSFHVVQGEREMARDCRSLAKFELTGLQAKPAGNVKVEVTFRVDVDGLLSVEAKDLATEKQTHVEIKPTNGLSQTHIAEMIQDSIKNAENDVHTRKYQEKIIQAEKLIAILEKIGDEKLQTGKMEIESAMVSQDIKLLNASLKKMESALEVFLQERMNTSLQKAIVGKSLTDVEELFS